MDVVGPETQEPTVAAVKVKHVMKEIVESVRLIPHECVRRDVEEIVDILVGVIVQERLQQRTAGEVVDILIPRIQEHCC